MTLRRNQLTKRAAIMPGGDSTMSQSEVRLPKRKAEDDEPWEDARGGTKMVHLEASEQNSNIEVVKFMEAVEKLVGEGKGSTPITCNAILPLLRHVVHHGTSSVKSKVEIGRRDIQLDALIGCYEFQDPFSIIWPYKVDITFGEGDVREEVRHPCMMTAIMHMQADYGKVSADDMHRVDVVRRTYRPHLADGFDSQFRAWYQGAQRVWAGLPRGSGWFPSKELTTMAQVTDTPAFKCLRAVIHATVDCNREFAGLLIHMQKSVDGVNVPLELRVCGEHPHSLGDFRSQMMIGIEKFDHKNCIVDYARDDWSVYYRNLYGVALTLERGELVKDGDYVEGGSETKTNDKTFAAYVESKIWSSDCQEPTHRLRYNWFHGAPSQKVRKGFCKKALGMDIEYWHNTLSVFVTYATNVTQSNVQSSKIGSDRGRPNHVERTRRTASPTAERSSSSHDKRTRDTTKTSENVAK